MSENVREDSQTEQKSANEPKVISNPFEQLRELCKGKFLLAKPIRISGKEIDELQYDLCALTGDELLDALDSQGANNMFAITNRQAVNVFTVSAANCTAVYADDGERRHVYPDEIRKGMSAPDMIRAAQIGKLFYRASSQTGRAGKKRTSNA